MASTYLDHFFFCFLAPVAAGAIFSIGMVLLWVVMFEGGGAVCEF
jgi:hypothetical protein